MTKAGAWRGLALLTIATTFAMLAACGAGTREVVGDGYSYSIPDDWEDVDRGTLGSELILGAQRAADPIDDFYPNVHVASESFTGDGPAYGKANVHALEEVAEIRESHDAKAGPRAGWEIEALWSDAAVPYVTLQRYGTNGTYGFVLTCSLAASAFEDERELCDEILDSFVVE